MTDLPPTRASLLVRLRDAGDQTAWRTFVDIYGPAIFAFARRRGLQSADAADLLQDVCRSVMQAIGRFEYRPELGRFRGWLFTILRNRLRLEGRKRPEDRGIGGSEIAAPLADLADESPEADEWELECRRRLFVWACDQVRPQVQPTTWTAFVRLAIDGASGEVVAKETGLSTAAVYLAKSRVLAKIRETLADQD